MLYEAVVGHGVWELLAHMPTDIAQIKGLQVTEAVGVEQQQDGHHLAVGQAAGAVAVPS